MAGYHILCLRHFNRTGRKNSSFEFISENRFFTDADSYTLSITFPLRGCKQNIDIFGHINRKDHDLERLLLDCEIHDRRSASRQGDALLAKNFHSYGSISIVEISEVEVKTQFFTGQSVSSVAERSLRTFGTQLSAGECIWTQNHQDC